MSVQFIDCVGFNNCSKIHGSLHADELDVAYVNAVAKAKEDGGFEPVLVPFGSTTPGCQIVASHVAAITIKLGFLVAHRSGFTQPTLSKGQLATLDQLSGGRSLSTSLPTARTRKWRATATCLPKMSAISAPMNILAYSGRKEPLTHPSTMPGASIMSGRPSRRSNPPICLSSSKNRPISPSRCRANMPMSMPMLFGGNHG